MAGSARPQGRGAGRRIRTERDSLARVLALVRSGRAVTRQGIEATSGLSRAVVAEAIWHRPAPPALRRVFEAAGEPS